MVDPKQPPSASGTPPAGSRRRRTAPTIDLTATELEASNPAPEPRDAAASAGEAPSPANDAPRPPAAEAAAGTPPPDPPSAPRARSWTRAQSWVQARLNWSHLAAGLIGGGVVCAILFAMWLVGLMPVVRHAGTGVVRGRVATLEAQVEQLQKDLQSRQQPTTSGADPKAIDDLSQRIAKLEQTPPAVAASDSTLAPRIEALENSQKALGIALTALNRRADEAAAVAEEAGKRADAAARTASETQNATAPAVAAADRGDLDALDKRVADLERASKSIEERVDKPAVATDPGVRVALALSALRTAVAAGEPLAMPLEAAKSLGVDAQQLAALEPYAQSGVPSEAQLASELRALIPALTKSSNASAPHDGGFLEKLQANASRLVQIRPLDAPRGDDAGAILARVEIKANAADVSGAMQELMKLPPAARAPAEAWIKAVNARQAAIEASRKLAGDAFRALSNRTP